MSDEIQVPFTQSTKDNYIKMTNIWLSKQEDYNKDFLFTDMKTVKGEWCFITKPSTEAPITSDVQLLTDRMCDELNYQVIR